MLKICFLSKKRAVFKKGVTVRTVDIMNSEALLQVLNEMKSKEVALYNLKQINRQTLHQILEIIDLNFFGNQMKSILVSSYHPKVFKEFSYHFELINDQF
jgi:hypothetical protein